MYSIYNKSPRRPVSAQSPHRVYNNDYPQLGSSRWGGLRLILRRRQICKNCISQKIENKYLLHEIHWLKTGVENMLKDKEAEVFDRVSKTMDDLYSENQRLNGKLLTEERIRVWGTSYTYSDKVDFVRERYHRSLDENADLERKISEKEKEVWDLKSRLEKKNSALKRFEEDLEKKENDVMKMKQRILELEYYNSGIRSALSKLTEECKVMCTRCNELTAENYQLTQELRDKRNTIFLNELHNELQEAREENQILETEIKENGNQIEVLKRQESQYRKDAIAAEKRIEDLKKENTRLKTCFTNELHNKLQETREEKQLKNRLKEKEKEIEFLKRQESQYQRDAIAAEKRIEDLNEENTRLKTCFPNELHNQLQETREEIQELKNKLKEKEKENEVQERQYRRDAIAAEKRIEDLKKENTRLMQEKGDMELMLRKKESETTVTRRNLENKEAELKSIKLRLYPNMEKEVIRKLKEDLSSKEKEIQRLKERVSTEERKCAPLQNRHLEDNVLQRKDSEIRELLRKNQYLSDEMNLLISEKKQKEEVVNKELDIKKEEIDRLQMRIRQLENRNIQLQKDIDPVSKDLYARNSNAADEVKILQTELEGTQGELQRLKERSTQDKEEKREMQEKISNISHERNSLLQRYSDTEKEVKQLKLEIKSKGEEIQLLQKQISQNEANNEKVKESLSNMAQEKQQLLERFEKVNSNDNNKLQLAEDESKRLQEKIRELLNKNSHQQNDIDELCKQKEDALTRMRSLEKVKSNCDDQLLLAKDESKRLQGKIKELQSENSHLRRDIDDLSKQKEDALTRLSKVAGAKLTHGNAAITDLSDTDRPTKLAEKFSELYDNAWTDAFEELDNTFHNEEETIKVLLRIFQEAYTFCVETENNYETRIGQAVFTLASKTGSHQIKNTNVEIQKVLADLRISLSTACCSVIEEMVLSKLPSILKSVDVAACPLTKLFACQCASLSWKMRIRDPPLFVRFEFRCGSTFNADVLKKYTKTGGYLDFLVWPTLYLHEKGPVLAKGVAQPKIAP